MRTRIAFLAFIIVLLCEAVAHAQCAVNYTAQCIGTTVCFTATGTSIGPVIPINIQRKYLLIQSESTSNPVYFAIGTSTTQVPLTAQVNVNTIQLAAQSPMPSNYEIDALDNPSAIRVPSGAIALIAPSGNVTVCILEHNG